MIFKLPEQEEQAKVGFQGREIVCTTIRTKSACM